ncbi:MAG: hypothetical protein AMJ79_14605 [Phycisphaerae bacterium SM23_30]|nr:MAG: hypothetical protein AMJ79_14605 [Phycisphaerae bacterium SM23_30]
MTRTAHDKNGQEGRPKTDVAKDIIEKLTEEERMLVILQSELYEHSWQAMLDDLHNRLEGKPYIFKLANRIQDDIARIEKLKAFEEEHNIKLADLITPPQR